jgi:flagellar hook-associated protein 2
MGSVGISFGSPTSGQGFDVATTVSSIVANLKTIETPWTTQLTTLTGEDTAFTSIGTDLSALNTALTSLTDFQGVLASKEGSSSNPNVLSLTSSGTTAVAGSHTVVVNALASTASYYSAPVASASDVLTGSFTVTFGSTSYSIAAGSGGESLTALANTINSADAGVTASLVNGTSGAELTIVSNTSGQAGNFTIAGTLTDTSNGNATIKLNNVGQTGADASLTVDNIAVTSGSNTVTNAIQGVTFQLLSTSTAPVQVEITNNNTSVESAVGAFVTAYNTVYSDLNTQEGNNSSGNPEPLFGNPAIATLQETLASALDFIQPAQAVGSSTTIASTDTLSGSLSISVGGGGTQTVNVGAGGTAATVAGLAAAINAANIGVTASVITSGTAATLSLANATSGSTGAISVNSGALTDVTAGTGVSFGSSQSNAVTSVTQLGITVNDNGTLSLDASTLDSLLNTNYLDVLNFLQPSSSYNSFGANFTTALSNLGNTAPNGVLYLSLQENQSEETALNANVTNENQQISTEQTNLTTELNQANYELQQIPSQLTEINEIYSSITGYNQNPA